MSRRSGAVALTLVVLGTVTACAPDPVDHALVTQWRADRQAEVDASTGLIAVLSSETTAGHNDGRVEASFKEPVLPTAITFDCFGKGTLDLQLDSSSTTDSGTTTTSTTLETVDCADGPHEIAPSALGTQAISVVGVATPEADRDTAWFLTVRGDDAL